MLTRVTLNAIDLRKICQTRRAGLSAKRVTSQDVARRAGVSRTTVSFVLNNVAGMQISEETRTRVLAAARDLGYVPDYAAQALASGRTKTIGLLLARRPKVIASDMYLTLMMETLVREINRRGMRLLLEVAEDFENSESYLKLVRSNAIDGVLYSGPRFDDQALQKLLDHGIPTVLMGALPHSNCYFVDINNRKAACTAVKHLIDLGHSQIACITNAPAAYVASQDRLLGYQDALEAAGIPLCSALVRYGDFNSESGYEQMVHLLKEKQAKTLNFSALFVASDVVAFGAMAAAREFGLRIPQDLAMVGFDDVPFSRYTEPALTTVHLPVAELAGLSSEIVVELVNGEKPRCSQVLLEADLVVRKSCGAR